MPHTLVDQLVDESRGRGLGGQAPVKLDLAKTNAVVASEQRTD